MKINLREPIIFVLKVIYSLFHLPVALIQVWKEVLTTTQTPRLANKKYTAMWSSFTTHANELRLICVPPMAEMVLLINSSKISDKFLTVFSIYIIPTNGNILLTVTSNSSGRVHE